MLDVNSPHGNSHSIYVFSLFAQVNTQSCESEHAKHITKHGVKRKHLFKISSNSEPNASELLENIEEMFPRY